MLKSYFDIFFVFLANTSKLEEQIKRIPKFDRVSLKNICDKGEVPKDIKKYQPKVIAFEVDRYILDTLLKWTSHRISRLAFHAILL
jgi:hypothetical protein